MVHIRQPFLSILSSIVFSGIALAIAFDAKEGTEEVMLGDLPLNPSAGWALVGILFLMAYFSLIYLKER